MSFKKASCELHVTPAAVSQQIKSLETHLRCSLFHRNRSGLELTESGRRLLPDLSIAFAGMERVLTQMSPHPTGMFKVASAPAFAAKFLVPNIDDFSRRHPGRDVYIFAAHELVDYEGEKIDIGIRYGTGDYGDLVAERLLSDAVLPVCSPQYISNRSIISLNGLLRRTLLHDDSLHFDPHFPRWQDWFSDQGVTDGAIDRGPRFNTASDAINAALQGSGVLLARRSLVQAELKTGRLVQVMDHQLSVPHGFFAVFRPSVADQEHVQLFRDWLHEITAEA